MSFLKNLFGGSPAGNVKETTTEKKENKKLIYPILKPGDWVGIKSGAMYRVLIGNDQNPQVVVGYGFETPENFEFLTFQDLKEYPGDTAHSESFKNISAYNSPWIALPGSEGYALTASGKTFSSEKLVCTDFLVAAEFGLKAKEIYVAIPRRGHIYAINIEAPPASMDKFIDHVFGIYHDKQGHTAPISDIFIKVSAGRFTGAVRFGPQ